MGCLKGWILIGAVLTVFIALGMVVVTIIATVQREKIIDKTDTALTNKVLVGMYLSSILLLLMGLSGLYGSLKKNKCLLGLFTIGTFVFVLVFATGMFLFFLGPKAIFDGTCMAPKNGFLIDLRDIGITAHDTLCRDKCPCNYQGDNADPSWNTSGTISRVEDCPDFRANANEADIVIMETFEKEFNCGGWCDDGYEKYFYFSDINKVPEIGCYQALRNFFDKYGIILGISCAAAFGVALLNIVMICCFCFHPSRAKNKRNLFRNLIEEN